MCNLLYVIVTHCQNKMLYNKVFFRFIFFMDLLKISHIQRTHPKLMHANKVVYDNLQNVIQYFMIFECIIVVFYTLTLILPKTKVISICHQYGARPACTSMQYDQPLCCWLTVGLISLKMITDSSKNGRWIIPFKKFIRLRVNVYNYSILRLQLQIADVTCF